MGRKRQLGVALDDRLREQLDALAAQGGRSIADEIRQRVERTLEQDAIEAPTRTLMAAIERLAVLVGRQTGRPWHSHPVATRVLCHAIAARLARLRGDGDAVFAPGELPAARLVTSDDPQTMGLGLEAIDFQSSQVEERLHELKTQARQTVRQKRQEVEDRLKKMSKGKRKKS
jgi:hypothetical protein